MGSFFGSVQVHRINREQVLNAAEEVAQEQKIKCLVGPTLGAWVGIYPERNGQDEGIGKAFAAKLGGDVLHLMVHDDDITAYWWWRDAQLVDSFWSRPGYFGDEDLARQKEHTGQPQLLAELGPGSADEFRRILDRSWHCPLEPERLEQLAHALGMDNALTAYEYLSGGERKGIRGWKDFLEVPQGEVERDKQARRAKQQQIRDFIKELTAKGLLLVRERRKDLIPAAAQAGDGFVVSWHAFGRRQTTIEHYRAPWKSGNEMLLSVHPYPQAITHDATGSRIAIASGKHSVVYDVDGWQVVADLAQDEWIHGAKLSPDGQLLACSSSTKTIVTGLRGGRQEAVLPGHARLIAVHPSNRWLVGASTNLMIASLGSGGEPRWREFFVGGQEQNFIAGLAARHRSGVATEEVGSQIEIAMKDTLGRIQELAQKANRNLDEEAWARIRTEVEAQMRSTLATWKDALPAIPARGNEQPVMLGFSADGHWLWCGTEKGLRVYSWEAVLECEQGDLPKPNHPYDPPMTTEPVQPRSGYVYAAVQEPAGSGLLFGGMRGILHRMDLATGVVRDLLLMPDEQSIIDLVLAQDGQTLGIVSKPSMLASSHKRTQGRVWSVWSYSGLA